MSCDLLIVGGEGDLALRKLYPALYSLWTNDCLPADINVLAIARRQLSREEFLELLRSWCDRSKSAAQFNTDDWATFTSRIEYCRQDATSSEGLARLRQDGALEYAMEDLRQAIRLLGTGSDASAELGYTLVTRANLGFRCAMTPP